MLREDKLLFYLVCIHENERLLPTVKHLLTQNLDWNYVIGKAIHNRIIPLLNHNLRIKDTKELTSLIPSNILDKIKELNYTFTGHSLVFHEEAKNILKCLDEATIEFTPIKGVLLDQNVYPKKYLRFFSDIDLLFPNSTEIKKAEQILLNLGFNHVFSNARESVFRKYRHGQSIHCDMHHSLTFFNFFEYPKIGGFWRKTSEATVSGVKVKVMSPEYMLIVLCLHSFLHGSFSLLDLSDAICILTKYADFNWHFISKQLEEYPCSLGIPITIIKRILHEYLDIIIPLKTDSIKLNNKKRFLSQIGEEPVQQSLGDLQYPLPYNTLCKRCKDERSCSISRFINERMKLQKLHTNRISDFILLEYYEILLILQMIRKKYGFKYALKCLHQEFKGIFTYIIHIIKSQLIHKPKIQLDKKENNYFISHEINDQN